MKRVACCLAKQTASLVSRLVAPPVDHFLRITPKILRRSVMEVKLKHLQKNDRGNNLCFISSVFKICNAAMCHRPSSREAPGGGINSYLYRNICL